MLIFKLFLPMSTPGLAALGLGAEAVSNGAFNAAEVIAIVVGLIVVAVAGIFTIRSNVAKIWREQAEGEKARNVELAADVKEQRDTIEQLQRDLAAALARPDMRELAELMGVQHHIVLTRLDLLDAHFSRKGTA